MPLGLDEIDRYHRQVLLSEWGAAGQERVGAARVLVHGRGPAARAAVRYLAGAGVGELGTEDDGAGAESVAINPHVIGRTIEHVTAREQADADALRVEVILDGAAGGAGRVCVACSSDSEVAGAGCAVEALKAILGLPHSARFDARQFHPWPGDASP